MANERRVSFGNESDRSHQEKAKILEAERRVSFGNESDRTQQEKAKTVAESERRISFGSEADLQRRVTFSDAKNSVQKSNN